MSFKSSPLNGFQRMMLRWEDFHPVNAAHVVELGGRHDASQIGELVRRIPRALGLLPISFDPGRHSLRRHDDDGGEPRFRVLTGPAAGHSGLEGVIREELGQPFGPDPSWPLRCFLLNEGDRQSFGVVYPHAISDSRGISLIVREILRALGNLPPLVRGLDFHPPHIKTMFPAELGWRGFVRRSATSLRELAKFTASFPPPRRSRETTMEPGVPDVSLAVATLKENARRIGGTVHTLIGAALTEALALNFADEIARTRRKAISLYTPVDLRREAGVPLERAVGQILGSQVTRATVPEGASFAKLAGEIARQTQRQRERGQYREQSSHMDLIAWFWDRFPRSWNRVASPFLMPLAGFISNVNLSDFLAEEIAAGLVQDYRRFTGTGIQTPMMLAITTVGPRANLTTTHHGNTFTREEMNRIVAHVAWRLSGDIEAKATRADYLARPLEPVTPPIRRAA